MSQKQRLRREVTRVYQDYQCSRMARRQIEVLSKSGSGMLLTCRRTTRFERLDGREAQSLFISDMTCLEECIDCIDCIEIKSAAAFTMPRSLSTL